MISEKVSAAINEQIKKEEYSSRIYMAMASWCEKHGFPGAASFLYEHSDEERMHMLKFVHYLNDRGGHSVLKDVEAPPSEYNSLLDIFEQVLAHEQYITGCINDLYEISVQEKDYTTGSFLQWFITEQIEEESLVNTILDKMKLVGGEKGGLFHIDKELEAMAQSPGGEAVI